MEKKTLAIVALIMIVAIGIGVVAAHIIQTYLFSTIGTVSTLGVSVRWVSDGTNVTTIDWGVTDNATEYVHEPINITNISNIPVTLSLTTQNHSPTIITLSLTWNYTGSTIAVDEWIIVELYQNVTATGAYSYDTVITADEA